MPRSYRLFRRQLLFCLLETNHLPQLEFSSSHHCTPQDFAGVLSSLYCNWKGKVMVLPPLNPFLHFEATSKKSRRKGFSPESLEGSSRKRNTLKNKQTNQQSYIYIYLKFSVSIKDCTWLDYSELPTIWIHREFDTGLQYGIHKVHR